MYQFKSARVAQSENAEELRQEIDQLRQENEVLCSYKQAAQSILADLALNPFADMDELRGYARKTLALTRRRNIGVIEATQKRRGALRAVEH